MKNLATYLVVAIFCSSVVSVWHLVAKSKLSDPTDDATLVQRQPQRSLNQPTYAGRSVAYWRERILEGKTESTYPSRHFPLRTNPDPEAIPVLVELSRDSDEAVRRRAIRCFEFLGEQGGPAVPVLVKALRDPEVCWDACEALSAIGRSASDAAPALMQLLSAPEEEMRLCAAKALWKVGGPLRPAVTVMIHIVHRRDCVGHPEIICEAAKLLGQIGGGDERVVPVLIRAMERCPRKECYCRARRIYAAAALGRLGAPARSAAGTLRDALADEEKRVRLEAAIALCRVTDDCGPGLQLLKATINEEQPPECPAAEHLSIRRRALRGLAELGPRGKEVLPDVMVSLEDANRWIRFEAALALWKIAGEVDKSLPILIDGVRNGGMHDTAPDCIDALADMGPRATAAIPVLKETLEHESSAMRSKAASSLKRIQQE